MAKKQKSFVECFDAVKIRIFDNKLTIQELAETIGTEEEILEILLNPNTQVIEILSKLILIMKIKLHYSEMNFKLYKIFDNKTQLKIIRTLQPFCSMYFDRATQEFYNFKLTHKHYKISKTTKEIIVSEMAEAIKKHLG